MRPEKWMRSPRDEEEAKDRALRSPHATAAKEGGMERGDHRRTAARKTPPRGS